MVFPRLCSAGTKSAKQHEAAETQNDLPPSAIPQMLDVVIFTCQNFLGTFA